MRGALKPILAAGCLLAPLAGRAAESNGVTQAWEADIRKFEAQDQQHPPPTNAVLLVGSSSIRLWPSPARDFPEVPVIQRGFGGCHMGDVVRYADRIVLPYKPRVVVIYAGDNDLAAGKTPERVFADFTNLAGRVHAKLPETRVAFIAIKPSPSRWRLLESIRAVNRCVAELAAGRRDLVYVDIFTPMLGPDGTPRKELFVADGLHMNAKGYALWVEAIRPYLR